MRHRRYGAFENRPYFRFYVKRIQTRIIVGKLCSDSVSVPLGFVVNKGALAQVAL